MKTLISLLLALQLSACGGDGSAPRDAERTSPGRAADTLYVNGVIWTGANGARDAAILAVRDGIVTYVGDGENVRIAAKETVDPVAIRDIKVLATMIGGDVVFQDGALR